ncbi:hypothetical protein BSL82_12535 [Tardibacter chloracetimidivorans]|uniref:Uncharacterized protein n=1 Tax=Tardibacter chloracetimidivorans TaxID=1921510 RepID=A0A1L3ZWM7_9SPHN|nr:hypothetical protein BSL82_12535 [Tardibacter chloracetimidivorans]
MTKLNWDKVSLRMRDPARAQQTNDILAPDEIMTKIEDLSARERRSVAKIEAKRATLRAALKAEESKRRAKRRAKRKAILREDAERAARLRGESEARRRERESGQTGMGPPDIISATHRVHGS